jgi:hypothetical protein
MGEEIALKKPVVLTEGNYNFADLEHLKKYPTWRISDLYERQSKDIFEIENPHLVGDRDFETRASAFAKKKSLDPCVGDWIYYPWSGLLLHCVIQEDQFKLRTNRNRNLVTEDEQRKLIASQVAIAGLSVGGQIAVGLAYSGIASSLVLADHDILETPNLNRVRASLADVGTAKIDIVSRNIWEIDPYAQLSLLRSGISVDTCDDFLEGSRVVFDEIDDFKMKVVLRHKAKTKKIPVVMLTGLGDSILIDVERYDIDSTTQVFNGLIGDLEDKILGTEVSVEDTKRYAAQIVGINNVPTRALESLTEIGKTIVGRPQLGSTVAIESGVASYLVREIILGSGLKNGRYRLGLNEIVQVASDIATSPERENILNRLMGN